MGGPPAGGSLELPAEPPGPMFSSLSLLFGATGTIISPGSRRWGGYSRDG